VTLLSGEGAVGKSVLLLQLSTATVMATDWIKSLPEPMVRASQLLTRKRKTLNVSGRFGNAANSMSFVEMLRATTAQLALRAIIFD
jgi:hypothetical protein